MKKKIGIVRGLMPRISQAEFAGKFKKMESVFITGEADREILNFCKKNKIKNIDLPIRPLYNIDPISVLTGKREHQSWVGVDSLERACKGLDALEGYELYHIFSGQAAEVAKKLNIPFICEVWTSFPEHLAYKIPPYSIYTKKVINFTSLFVGRSRRATLALVNLGVPKDKIITIYHGVDIGKFKPKLKKKSQNIRFLFVGALEESKGVGLLLKIAPVIVDKFPFVEFWMVGSGSLRENAENTKGVKVMGYVNHDELPYYYNQCDIFISPSIERRIGPFLWNEEFFGYTFMEAQACGLPIITTNCGGIPENVGSNNILVPQNSQAELENAIEKAIIYRDKMIEIGLNNRARAEKLYDINAQVSYLEDKILKLMH